MCLNLYMHKLIIITVAILIVIGFVYYWNIESFENSTIKKPADIVELKQQFDDIVVYDNDKDGRIGLDKCIENCNGYCVEYGMTGSANCFPVHEKSDKNFYGNVVPNEVVFSTPLLQ